MYKSPYFLDAKIFEQVLVDIVEFIKVYRQKNGEFLNLLNNIRANDITEQDLQKLNTRWNVKEEVDNGLSIYLTSTNKLADDINCKRLLELEGNTFINEVVIEGKFDTRSLPTHESLEFKIGAQVMLLNNEWQQRWTNGSLGKIVNIIEQGEGVLTAIHVKLETGDTVVVEPFQWDLYRFFYNESTNLIDSESIGSFKQFPLKLAWAVTIHKSQGKTFDNVILDIGWGAFCHGQIYVALSRCTSFEGITLKQKIRRKDIWVDKRVKELMQI